MKKDSFERVAASQVADIWLPEEVDGLYDLAYNLWWSWNHSALRMFGSIESRSWLEHRRETLAKEYPPGEVPLPDFWGGYILAPQAIEFWQGRPARLHDRILYERKAGASWEISRLSP